MSFAFDRVFYWVGGSQYIGRWEETPAIYHKKSRPKPGHKDIGDQTNMQFTADSLRNHGFITRFGYKDIGPPETPPSAKEFRELAEHLSNIGSNKMRKQ